MGSPKSVSGGTAIAPGITNRVVISLQRCLPQKLNVGPIAASVLADDRTLQGRRRVGARVNVGGSDPPADTYGGGAQDESRSIL
jgi:hypothetical protein